MRADCQGRHGPGAWPPQVWELLSDVSERATDSQAGEPVTRHAGDSRVEVLGVGVRAQVAFPGRSRLGHTLCFGSFCEPGHFLESCHSGA